MNGLDLFSGIGGISIALEPWVRTVAYCERDRYAQSVLLSRMQDGKIDRAPIWDDVTTLKAVMLPRIDIIFGGFPCQDISVAGNGRGLAGERSGLFFEIVRLAKETRAPFIFLENVPAIRTRGLREVARAFTEVGYDCRWTCLSAASVGANHKRERWFLLAYSANERHKIESKSKQSSSAKYSAVRLSKNVPNSDSFQSGNKRQTEVQNNGEVDQWETFSGYNCSSTWWSVEPNVGRVVNGLPNRVDRIKCLGNSVVPIQARTAFMRLIGMNLEYIEISKKRIEAA